MKKLIVSVIAVLAIAISANATNYKVDNNAIDALIENATEVVALEAAPAAALPAFAPKSASEVNPTTALLLSWLLGEFGIHRHYMGTKPIMWLLYTITGGGLGIIWGVDTIMLLLNVIQKEGIEKWINNEKFIVWLS